MLRQIRWQILTLSSILILLLLVLGGYLIDRVQQAGVVLVILGSIGFLGVFFIAQWISSTLQSNAAMLAKSITQLATKKIEHHTHPANPSELQILQDTIQSTHGSLIFPVVFEIPLRKQP
ncbi:MAG: hypothetical protein MAG431_00223 [Chloroflexi bacterium]|nr:hypothetical protein [Chloroflexota bacterium]